MKNNAVLCAAPDGKLYDGYVSFQNRGSAETAHFALHILPKELEKKHGYSLYIRGRDDCPGEGQEHILSCFIFKGVVMVVCAVCVLELVIYPAGRALNS